MKEYLTAILLLACVALVIALVVIKRGDSAQAQADAGSITDFSNRLDSAQMDLTIREGAMIILSNSLDQCQSASLALSNQLTEAQSTLALDADQITNLSQQAAQLPALNTEIQSLSVRITDLTNQMAGLTRQISLGDAALAEANKNYGLLENRLRRDVAARLVVERKFNNPPALEAQQEYLKQHPGEVITADRIYADLDVEVKSNSFHVISPN